MRGRGMVQCKEGGMVQCKEGGMGENFADGFPPLR